MANFLQKLFRPEYQWQLLDMVKSHDIEYIKKRSIGMDLKLIFKTFIISK